MTIHFGPIRAMAQLFLPSALLYLLIGLGGCNTLHRDDMTSSAPMVHYLELVTPEVDATCATYEATLGVTFGELVPELGNARLAEQAGGGWISVRGPMRADEGPVTRAYLLVDDIAAAVSAAAEAGAQIALPPMEIPGRGTCAIFIQGGIEHALWQN